MTREAIYNIWAPVESRWAVWAKPVLFAHLPMEQAITLDVFDVDWLGQADGRAAVVVDLPGATSVAMGMALARKGYRPVPLYNAVPGQPKPAVEMGPIAAAIVQTTAELSKLKIGMNAPSAFLLDHRRRGGTPLPGDFDNRSISLPTDFPSSRFLQEHGIARAVVVQPEIGPPQTDLSHTLLRWQEGGIGISVYGVISGEGPQVCIVERPKWYKAAWHSLMVTMGLKRNVLGGFGGVLPLGGGG